MSRNLGLLLALPVLAVSQSVFAKDYLSVADAQLLLFPTAERFLESTVTLSKDQKRAIKKRSGMRQRWDQQKIWRAEANGELLGWLIADEVVGKHEFISYATAVSPAGEILGVEILSYRETHGDQIRDVGWRANLVGKSLEDQLQLGKDIPNISGATLSCRNVTDGVRRLLVLVELVLKDA